MLFVKVYRLYLAAMCLREPLFLSLLFRELPGISGMLRHGTPTVSAEI